MVTQPSSTTSDQNRISLWRGKVGFILEHTRKGDKIDFVELAKIYKENTGFRGSRHVVEVGLRSAWRWHRREKRLHYLRHLDAATKRIKSAEDKLTVSGVASCLDDIEIAIAGLVTVYDELRNETTRIER